MEPSNLAPINEGKLAAGFLNRIYWDCNEVLWNGEAGADDIFQTTFKFRFAQTGYVVELTRYNRGYRDGKVALVLHNTISQDPLAQVFIQSWWWRFRFGRLLKRAMRFKKPQTKYLKELTIMADVLDRK